MRHLRTILVFVGLLLVIGIPAIVWAPSYEQVTPSAVTAPGSEGPSRLVDLGDGFVVEVGPSETLYRYTLTEQGLVEWVSQSDPLLAYEYGRGVHSQQQLTMRYIPGSGTTGTSLVVPTGAGWEGYHVDVSVSGLTENRTWVQNPDFTTSLTPWTAGTSNAGSFSLPITRYLADGRGPGDGCVEFEIDSQSTSAPYFYDADDLAYVSQTLTINRGTVVWAGFRMDYWADTQDDTHYGMEGSFAIYVDIEGQREYILVFGDIGAEETWFTSPMVEVNPSIFALPSDQSVSLQIGLWSKVTVGYTPEIGPRARVDNFELYLKTRATPSSVSLTMNGIAVQDGSGYGQGSVSQTPGTPWHMNPILLNFTWTPSPNPPSPNRVIVVEFDVSATMFARRLNVPTVWDISPTAYGETLRVQNGTDVFHATYFYADIPFGYEDMYFFNVSLDTDRDVYTVARPLAPSTNLTSGWTGGQPGDGFLNVSAYLVATGAGRYGYWRILSRSPNMISEIQMFDKTSLTWKRTVDLRAGMTTRARAFVGAAYQNSLVNFTVYAPSGATWTTLSAVVDAQGYATTTTFTLGGGNATAGQWMVEARSNDRGTSGHWTHAGFFKRTFSVTHASSLKMVYPTEAAQTWVTNVTYGDLMLLIVRANDTDSGTPIAGGSLQYSWIGGSGSFDDTGTGDYTKVLDTSVIQQYGSGQYVITLSWSASYYDPRVAYLTVNVNYRATLTSPQYPGISGAVGSGQWFDVVFQNVNGTGITGALITCNWTSSYSVNPQGGGLYRVSLSGSGVPLGRYLLQVYARAPFVVTQSLLIYVDVREIYNIVDYSANQLSIPVGESRSFTLRWTDVETGLPITGGSSYITCNWTSAAPVDYTVTEKSSGLYEIVIYTSDSDPLTGPNEFRNVVFNVNRRYYQNHTFTIGVQVRTHNTLFVLDSPVEQTPYGSTIVVLVYYEDIDLMLPITNGTGNVRIVVTSSGVSDLRYHVLPSSLGNGHYNITIGANQWGNIGWKDLVITVEWTGPVLKYMGKTIMTSVRVLGTNTDLFIEQAPPVTYYLETVSFTIVYYDSVNATRISNSTFHVHLSISPITPGHPVTQSDFVIHEIGTSGVYSLSIDSTKFGKTGVFSFLIGVSWDLGVAPHYENRTLLVTLVILERPTYLDYQIAPSAPYGLPVTFVFAYVDSLTATRIPQSASLHILINEPYVVYSYEYSAVDRSFTLTINTSSLGGVGTFIIHLNITWVGAPYYASIPAYSLSVSVLYRNTQLVHEPFQLPQYGSSVVFTFTYIDLVSGSPQGMVGVLSLNETLYGYYSVVFLGDGVFRVTLDTSGFPSTGRYTILARVVYTGTNFENNATETLAITVLPRSTQMIYYSPDPAQYLDSVVFVLTYVDDLSGSGIDGASITVSCNTSSLPLVRDSNYWVTPLGNGNYRVSVSTVALGSLGTFILNVTASYSGAPFYHANSRTLNARVTERATAILIVRTPGDTPFLENVTLRFRYIDSTTGALIILSKSNIVLKHGPSQSVIAASQYYLLYSGTYYEIGFNSTLLSPTSLVTNWEILMEIDMGLVEPFYAAKSATTRANTIERPTTITFPQVSVVPYLSNLTIVVRYLDYLRGVGVSGADVSVSFLNISNPVYHLIVLPGGEYKLIVPTGQFGRPGTVYFSLTLSRSGLPFYASRSITDVPAVVRPIQALLVVPAASLGVLPPGYPIVINATLYDMDYGGVVSGATVTTTWTAVTGRPYQVHEIQPGVYRITLDTQGLLAQKYTFSVIAQKQHFADASAPVVVQPGSQILAVEPRTLYFSAEWGQLIHVVVDVRQFQDNTPVPGASVVLSWGTLNLEFADLGNGTYSLDLDTSLGRAGAYTPTITVSRAFYQPRQVVVDLLVFKANGVIIPSVPVLNIVRSTSQYLVVYLSDVRRGIPISDALVSVEWNTVTYPMSYNGTPGYYAALIDTVGLPMGLHSAVVRASHDNLMFLDLTVDVSIIPVPARVGLVGGAISISLYYGEILHLAAEYNDTYFGGHISGANVTLIIGSFTVVLEEGLPGVYAGTFNTSLLNAQSLLVRVVASKEGYARVQSTVLVVIRPLPTLATSPMPIQSAYRGDELSYLVTLYQTLTNSTIAGADVTVTWTGTVSGVLDLGNGSYLISLVASVDLPRAYTVEVTLVVPNHEIATIDLELLVRRTPAYVVGDTSYDTPVGRAGQVSFYVVNALTGGNITGLNGIAIWDLFGEQPLLISGDLYILTVSSDFPIGVYGVAITFPTSLYEIATFALVVEVRTIRTTIQIENTTIQTSPGAAFEVTLRYVDLDSGGVGIDGATIDVYLQGTSLIYYPDRVRYLGDGIYVLLFQSNEGGVFTVTVTLLKERHEPKTIVLNVISDVSQQQLLVQSLLQWGSVLIVLASAITVLWVKYLSVPRMIRIMNGMISTLSKGRIPKIPVVLSRQSIAAGIVNDELRAIGLSKSLDDIDGEPIKPIVPEVNELLQRLAEITGLGDAELDAFRADLARMKPSERPGFLREVIRQEEARRAEQLARVEAPTVIPSGVTPADLEELKLKLKRKGIAPEEIELILEHAKSLSRADLEALLDSLGIDL